MQIIPGTSYLCIATFFKQRLMKHIRTIYYLFIVLLLNACYPDSIIYPEETDVVYTNYSSGVDFQRLKYYIMKDSVFRISGEVSSHHYFTDYDDLLLSHFEANLQKRGYARVDEDDSISADIVIIISDLSYIQVNYYWNYIPYGYYYPQYYHENMNAFYSLPPPTGVFVSSSSYIMVDMLENISSNSSDTAQVYWRGVSNGVLRSNMEARLMNNIDRMFVQSPYLKPLNE